MSVNTRRTGNTVSEDKEEKLNVILGVSHIRGIVTLMKTLSLMHMKRTRLFVSVGITFYLITGHSSFLFGAAAVPVWSLAEKEKSAFLETLQELVSIESGSRDRQGLDKISTYIAAKLSALGGKVELIEPGADTYRMSDTPATPGRMVLAQFTGEGTPRILMLAHMDTVYSQGSAAEQPFRIDENRAFGLGIADDKQGIAMILHSLAILKSLGFRNYGLITVLINGDEEISSPASRTVITQLGASHDAIFSFEASRVDADKISLATSGIAAVTLTVKGRASHSGFAPEKGVNALYELAHQILQTRGLSDPSIGTKLNWTMANAGVTRNMIPPSAQASADVRVLRVSDYADVETKIRELVKNKLLPDSEVQISFERRRPPLEASSSAKILATHAQAIYREIDKALLVDDQPEGGGTDAAFAALNTRAPVLERLGLLGFGEHSDSAEYVLLDSIAPRLYLATRMIIEIGLGKILREP
jgi:glutamate carboxypeptidase